MERREQNNWPKTITVDKNIVSVLSQSTYDNFPRALKELITNSYDADAKEVSISVDLEKEVVEIADNGRGMNDVDFDFYLRIAGKNRKKEDNTTPLGRKIIGQFGVGFLAVFPFFKSYTIESKKAGANSILHANIPLIKYFSSDNRFVDIGSIAINGGTRIDVDKSSRSFTKITLSGFSDLTRSFFYPKNKKADKSSIESYSPIDKLKWILADDLPLKFEDARFNQIFSDESKTQFDVFVNGDQLLRKVYGDEILEIHQGYYKQIGKIKFKYCILTPRKSVKPYQARFLKIRNLNVGVGKEREDFGEGRGTTRSRLHWLTGEVHILEGMNELIKVSRDAFNYSSDYEELKVFFNSKLNYYSNRLEEEDALKREIQQTGKEFRVSNLSILKPEAITKKLKRLEDEGFEIKTNNSEFQKVKINNEKKEVLVPSTFRSLEKHIVIKKKRYKIEVDSWDYQNEIFPACSVDKNTIRLNSNYPLFSGKKYTDLFVKLHLMLMFNYLDKQITKANYSHLLSEILEYYSDYK